MLDVPSTIMFRRDVESAVSLHQLRSSLAYLYWRRRDPLRLSPLMRWPSPPPRWLWSMQASVSLPAASGGAHLGYLVDLDPRLTSMLLLWCLCCLLITGGSRPQAKPRRLQRSFHLCSSGCSYRLYVYPVVAPRPCSVFGRPGLRDGQVHASRLLLDIAQWPCGGFYYVLPLRAGTAAADRRTGRGAERAGRSLELTQ